MGIFNVIYWKSLQAVPRRKWNQVEGDHMDTAFFLDSDTFFSHGLPYWERLRGCWAPAKMRAGGAAGGWPRTPGRTAASPAAPWGGCTPRPWRTADPQRTGTGHDDSAPRSQHLPSSTSWMPASPPLRTYFYHHIRRSRRPSCRWPSLLRYRARKRPGRGARQACEWGWRWWTWRRSSGRLGGGVIWEGGRREKGVYVIKCWKWGAGAEFPRTTGCGN